MNRIDPYAHVADLVRELGGVCRAARLSGVDAGYLSRVVNRKRPITLHVLAGLEEAARMHARRDTCGASPSDTPYPTHPVTCR